MFMRTSINVVREHASIFFKQKTAYEMRISDWSSDVCSSDLSGAAGGAGTVTVGRSPPAGFHVSARPSASVMRSTHAGAPPTRSSAVSRPTGRPAASSEIVAHLADSGLAGVKPGTSHAATPQSQWNVPVMAGPTSLPEAAGEAQMQAPLSGTE